jgi:polar amino acid transport system ATP-binding protein
MQLTLTNLHKSFGAEEVLRGLDLRLPAFEALCVIGPSGGGKSTLLRILAGLEVPSAGQVEIDGQPLPQSARELVGYRRRIGTVFQQFNLFPHLTALQNITLPLEVAHKQPRPEARARAMELLERFGLGAHARKKPAQLSGGQKQRVAIARALAAKPMLLLFDEPTSALDPEMAAEVMETIAELRAEGRRLVLVTHQMNFARRVSDWTLFLGQGKVVEAAPSEEVFNAPKSPEVQRYLELTGRY